jgi:hypothetical protein
MLTCPFTLPLELCSPSHLPCFFHPLSTYSSFPHLQATLPTLTTSTLEEDHSYSDGEDQTATVTIVEEDFTIDTSTPLPGLPPTDPASQASALASERAERSAGGGEKNLLGKKLKMQSGAKPKNKSGKKTLLRGTKAMLIKKSNAKKFGGGDASGGGGGAKDSKGRKK